MTASILLEVTFAIALKVMLITLKLRNWFLLKISKNFLDKLGKSIAWILMNAFMEIIIVKIHLNALTILDHMIADAKVE